MNQVFGSSSQEESEWTKSRDGLGVTFLAIATPISLAVEIPEGILPWLKASIYLSALGTLLSTLRKRWRPWLDRSGQANPPGLWYQMKLSCYETLRKHGEASSTTLLFLALMTLLVAVYLR